MSYTKCKMVQGRRANGTTDISDYNRTGCKVAKSHGNDLRRTNNVFTLVKPHSHEESICVRSAHKRVDVDAEVIDNTCRSDKTAWVHFNRNIQRIVCNSRSRKSDSE